MLPWLRDLANDSDPVSILRSHLNDLPHLKALDGVPQDPVYHPEGDALRHTFLTVEAMARICDREQMCQDDRLLFLLTMTCHDLGKVSTTFFHPEKGRWVSPGHDQAGVPLAQETLNFLGNFQPNFGQLLPLVRWHMSHCRKDFSQKTVLKLARLLQPATIESLVWVMEADCAGRGSASGPLPAAVTQELIPIAERCGVFRGG